MIPRHITPRLLDALSDTPVVLLAGARQTGKTTLVQALAEHDHPARYLTLDTAAVLEAARSDPAGFLSEVEGPLILDEAQRAPEFFLPLKEAVDRNRQPGRYLLTGSANVLFQPRLSEPLVGRMEVLPLWPFAQCEIEGREGRFVDALFEPGLQALHVNAEDRPALASRLVRGGFPEAVHRSDSARRDAWLGSYVTALIERDVRDLAQVEGLRSLPRLLSLLAARSSTLLNFASLARDGGFAQTTLRRYVALLEATYLVTMLPAWSANLGKRLVKAPKIHMVDTGVLCHLLGADIEQLLAKPELFGAVLETFVIAELTRQASWGRTRPRLHYFRAHAGLEVDVILESPRGHVAGVEVKAAASVQSKDFTGLRFLAEALGSRFSAGAVLYTGRECVPFGENLWALPVQVLWA